MDYSIPNAKAFGLPLTASKSRLEPLSTIYPKRSRWILKKRHFLEEIQKLEKGETKDIEFNTVEPEVINANLEVIPDISVNHFLASSSYTLLKCNLKQKGKVFNQKKFIAMNTHMICCKRNQTNKHYIGGLHQTIEKYQYNFKKYVFLKKPRISGNQTTSSGLRKNCHGKD